MTKLSSDELDTLVLLGLNKSSAPVLANGVGQEENPMQTGENSKKEPPLRKPIDAIVNAGTTVGAGALGLAASLSKITTKQPMQEVQ